MMELALTSYFSKASFTVSHVNRVHNKWADQLSKGDLQGFSPSLRHTWDWEDDSQWLLWPALRDDGYARRSDMV